MGTETKIKTWEDRHIGEIVPVLQRGRWTVIQPGDVHTVEVEPMGEPDPATVGELRSGWGYWDIHGEQVPGLHFCIDLGILEWDGHFYKVLDNYG